MMTQTDGTAMLEAGAARIKPDLESVITGPIRDAKAFLDGDFLSTGELAALIHVDPSTLRRWRNAEPPEGPPFSRLSPGVVVYNTVDVRYWIARGRIDPAERA